MAYCDYTHCDICDCKTYYDADVDYEWNTGSIKALCKECSKYYKITIKKTAKNAPARPPHRGKEVVKQLIDYLRRKGE